MTCPPDPAPSPVAPKDAGVKIRSRWFAGNLDHNTPHPPWRWDVPFPRRFVCYFHYSHWTLLNFGVSVDVGSPNIEIHMPGGFIRAGWVRLRHPTGKRFCLGVEQYHEIF